MTAHFLRRPPVAACRPSAARILGGAVAAVLMLGVPAISGAPDGVPTVGAAQQWTAGPRAAAPALQPLQTLGPWYYTGDLNVARKGHATALLPDGRVLAAGAGGDGTLDPAEGSVESYDPVTGAWSGLLSLRPPLRNASALVLPDGTVLIAGGDSGNGSAYRNPASILDADAMAPSALATGGLATPRSFQRSVVLPDGSVLATGGGDPGFLASVERFDSGVWQTAASLDTPREFHSATELTNGDVVVIGGASTGGRLASIERFGFSSGQWQQVADLSTDRAFHTATLLPDGRVLVAGGDNGTGVLASAEIYDPGTDTVQPAGAMATPRRHHTAEVLRDGRVIVIGGDGPGPLSQTEVFDPSLNSWTSGPPLNDARRYHSSTVLDDGRILVAGGMGVAGTLASAELLDQPCRLEITIDVTAATPDAILQELLKAAGWSYPADYKPLGGTATDKAVAHSFVGLKKPGMRIVAAQLSFTARPAATSQATNDAFHVLSGLAWGTAMRSTGRFFGTGVNPLPGLGLAPWMSGAAAWVPVSLNLASQAPPGDKYTPSVLAAMNELGRLDFYVQDDTAVDRLRLRLTYVCCDVWDRSDAGNQPVVGDELDEYLTGINYPPVRRKGFNDPIPNTVVAHTFDGLSQPDSRITEAKLLIVAAPGGSNDSLHALVPPAAAAHQFWFFDAGQSGPNLGANWTAGGPAQAFTVPITDPDVLDAMNQDGRLDVYVEDDTNVLSLALIVYQKCCGSWTTTKIGRAASPSPELLQALATLNTPKGFGDPAPNQPFAHTFGGLSVPGMHIAALELVARGVPGTGPDAANDTVTVMVAGGTAPRRDWNLASVWDAMAGETFGLYASIWGSPGDLTLLQEVNAQGRLDVYLQDDIRVDQLRLRLLYKCGAFPEPVKPDDGVPWWGYMAPVSRPDVWIDDSPEPSCPANPGACLDSGIEGPAGDPAMTATPMWQSRAIWVRNGYDGSDPLAACKMGSSYTAHQNPKPGQTNTVCVLLRDRGPTAYPPGKGVKGGVALYAAEASSGLDWHESKPTSWTQITAVPAVVPIGGMRVVAVPWAVPANSPKHVCLLARYLAPPDPFTFEPGAGDAPVPVGDYARRNNNVAWRNVNVINGLAQAPGGGRVIVRDIGSPIISRTLAVAVRVPPESEGGGFLARGKIRIDLPAAFFDAWLAAGGRGTGFKRVPGAPAVETVGAEGAWLEGLPLGPGEEVPIDITASVFIPDDDLALADSAARGGTALCPTCGVVELLQYAQEDDLWLEQGGVAYVLRPDSEVPPPTIGRLSNISTRGRVGVGADVLIGGFIVEDGPVDVIMRAIGPELKERGVPGSLKNPTLEVYDQGGTSMVMCDDWAGCPGADQLGGLTPKYSAEPALRLTLPPGQYTGIVRGKGGSRGVALVEVFYMGGSGRLTNISTRGKVGRNADVMIGGIIVKEGQASVILRAIGPDLTGRGVPGALEDPILEIYDRDGNLLSSCDDWAACEGASGLGGLTPNFPSEPAMRLSLPPGEYTGIVRGKDGSTGVALVEAFSMD